MEIDNTAGALKGQIEQEVRQYTTETVDVAGSAYSQYKLTRRISLFESHTYPGGKFDKQGHYKFWFDIIIPRINSEVKNIDFDTKDVKIFSERRGDDLAVQISNLKLKEYLRDTGQAEEFNAAVEEGSGWGNVVWKQLKKRGKSSKSYERVDLKNFYVINQTAETLAQTPVIERHQMSSSDLRAKVGVWQNVKEVLENCKHDTFKSQIGSQAKDTTVPYYDIYERNGEVCLKDLKETLGEQVQDGDEDEYTFAKVIAAGTEGTTGVTIEYILFAQELKGKDNSDLYEEFHRSVYAGTWFRRGMYETLFDHQVRANQIGNQIAQGLEFGSKLVLGSNDKLIVQNIFTDLKNGDIVKTADLKQVDLRMHGFDQLIADWNRNLEQANDLANSREIVMGITPASGTPLGTSQLLDQNAGKLFDFIREKLAVPFSRMFEKGVVPDHIQTLSAKDIIRLVGDGAIMDRIYAMVVDAWHADNLLAIGPHDPQTAAVLKEQQIAALKRRPELLMKGLQKVFKDFQPSVSVIITGEQSSLPGDMQNLKEFTTLETDPVRRSAMVELAMAKSGIDVAALPKSAPLPVAAQ